MSHTKRLLAALLGGAALIVAGCSSEQSISTSSDASTSSAPSSSSLVDDTSTSAVDTSTTTAETSTTVAPTTVAPAPATTVPAGSPPLRGNGIGTWTFGTPITTVVDGLNSVIGAPVLDETSTYPNFDGSLYLDDFEEVGFIFPVARQVCWSNDLCGYFGGTDAASLTFTGWEYFEEPGSLLTIEGISVGDRWAGWLAEITAYEGGCYSSGYGYTGDGVEVYLVSTGEEFSFFDEAGNYVEGNPDPADVYITGLHAGEQIAYLFADC